jgi:hypothetical protein
LIATVGVASRVSLPISTDQPTCQPSEELERKWATNLLCLFWSRSYYFRLVGFHWKF